MRVLTRIAGGLKALFRKARVERELDAELRDYLDASTQEKLRGGLTREDALRAARVEMGSLEAVKDRVRDVGWESAVDALFQDLRYGFRTMRRAPGFAAIAIGSSALGVGASALIFAVLNFAVLKPLPVGEPGRLLSLSEIDRRTGEIGNELSFPDFRDLRQARAFEGVAAYDPFVPTSIGSSNDPQRHWAGRTAG